MTDTARGLDWRCKMQGDLLQVRAGIQAREGDVLKKSSGCGKTRRLGLFVGRRLSVGR